MKILLLLVGFALLWGAGQGIYIGVTNLEQTSISCSEFEQNGTDKVWIELTDCYIDNLDVVATFKEGDSNIDKNDDFYVSIKSSQEGPVFAFLKINDEFAKATYANVFFLQDDEAKYLEFFERNPEQEEYVNTEGMSNISGLVLFGIDSEDADLDVLKGFIEREEFAILDQNAEPDIGMSIFLFLLGLGSFGLFGYLSRGKSE